VVGLVAVLLGIPLTEKAFAGAGEIIDAAFYGAWAIGGMNWRPLRLFMSSIPDGAKRKSPCALESHIPPVMYPFPAGKPPNRSGKTVLPPTCRRFG